MPTVPPGQLDYMDKVRDAEIAAGEVPAPFKVRYADRRPRPSQPRDPQGRFMPHVAGGLPRTSPATPPAPVKLTPSQVEVLSVFRKIRVASANEIRFILLPDSSQTEAGIRARVSELVKLGLLRRWGKQRNQRTGRVNMVWQMNFSANVAR